MEALEMKDMQVGWWGLFDALYGPEKVLSITRYTLGRPLPGGASAGSGVEVLHLQVTDERGDESSVGRFITRAAYEPVMAMSFPDLPVEVGAVATDKLAATASYARAVEGVFV